MGLFQRRDLEQYTDSLAQYMPGGILFSAKSIKNSNFRKLLRGMAGELFRSNGYLISYSEEILPDQTVKFISEWESALGIPDLCFNGTGTITERRRDILTKLASLGVQTVDDFEALALIFGVTVDVLPGLESAVTFATTKDARFTIVVNITLPERFPYTFPITFGDSTTALLECIFNQLKPSNCKILFEGV